MGELLIIHAHGGSIAGVCEHIATAGERGFDLCRIRSTETMLLLAGQGSGCPIDGDLTLFGQAFVRDAGDVGSCGSGYEDPAVARVARAAGRHWGDHILVASLGRTTAIATSAFGQQRLYRRTFHEAELLSTSPALLQALTATTSRINWDQFADFLRWPEVRTQRTCLDGLTRLPPATCLQLTGDRAILHTFWSPWAHVAPADACADELARDLEVCIDRCMQAWSERFTAPLLELSGGLDSSIIAASLARSRSTFSAATMVPASADGDEQGYATSVCETFGIPLDIIEATASAVDLSALPSTLTPEPMAHPVAAHIDQHLAALAMRSGHDAFFNGGGGDNVFARLSSAAPVADRLRSGAPLPAVWRTIGDVARLTHATHWAVIANAARRLRPTDADRWPADPSLITKEPRATQPHHPWLKPPQGTLPGKKRHVQSLVAAQSYGDTAARQAVAPLVLPLLSQPIVERCLAIPSWQWVAGGVDRAVARQAFAARLPSSVTHRRSKGALDGLFAALFQKNRQTIRDALLGGRLASSGLLDLAEIERLSARDSLLTGTSFYRMVELTGYEFWARSVG